MRPPLARSGRWRAGLATRLAPALLVAVACRAGPERPRRDAPEEPPVGPLATASGSVTPPRTGAVTSAPPTPVPSAVVALRAQRLALGTRRVAPGRLAFTRRHLAVLTATELVLFETKSFTVARRFALSAPRKVVATVDGGFAVADADATLQVTPRDLSLVRHPRLTLFASSELWADRRDPLVLWVHHEGEAAIYRYHLDPMLAGQPLLAPADRIELLDHDGRAVLALKDGSFAYTAPDELHQLFPHGKARTNEIPSSLGELWRLLPTRRIDQLWTATTELELELWQLAPRLRSVRRLALGGKPFDLATSDQSLAVVRTAESTTAPRQWSLVVYDDTGRERFTAALPPDPEPTTEDWVERAIRDREVALARADPWVAVGGPTAIAVWETGSGETLLDAAQGAALLVSPTAGTVPSAAPRLRR